MIQHISFRLFIETDNILWVVEGAYHPRFVLKGLIIAKLKIFVSEGLLSVYSERHIINCSCRASMFIQHGKFVFPKERNTLFEPHDER